MSEEVKTIIFITCMILSINKEIPPAELTVWGGFESFALQTVSLIIVYHKPPKKVKGKIEINPAMRAARLYSKYVTPEQRQVFARQKTRRGDGASLIYSVKRRLCTQALRDALSFSHASLVRSIICSVRTSPISGQGLSFSVR